MRKLTFRTWHAENLVVAAVLLSVWALTGFKLVELLGAAAVLCGFCHASIAERMRECEAARAVPDVECHRLSTWFFLAKEAGWFAYFAIMGAWSALVGCGVFLAYPLWRKWWRRIHPLSIAAIALLAVGCSKVDEPTGDCIDAFGQGWFVCYGLRKCDGEYNRTKIVRKLMKFEEDPWITNEWSCEQAVRGEIAPGGSLGPPGSGMGCDAKNESISFTGCGFSGSAAPSDGPRGPADQPPVVPPGPGDWMAFSRGETQ